MDGPIPDLVARKIAGYLYADNKTLVELRRVSKPFLAHQEMLLGQVVLNWKQSKALYFSKDPFHKWAIGRVHTLDLIDTNVSDVSQLGGVHDLSLAFTRVSDVSQLGGVHTLNLWGCKRVTDVSQLGGVHTLTLRYTGVTDFSALSGVKYLYN